MFRFAQQFTAENILQPLRNRAEWHGLSTAAHPNEDSSDIQVRVLRGDAMGQSFAMGCFPRKA